MNGTHPNELKLNGSEAVWTGCARSSIKDKPTSPIAAVVRVKFKDDRSFVGASCTGCSPPLNACIAGAGNKGAMSVNFKSGDVTNQPDWDVPVTFTCD